jgi:phosphohistidine phosphatase
VLTELYLTHPNEPEGHLTGIKKAKKQRTTGPNKEEVDQEKATSPKRARPRQEKTAPTKLDVFILRHGEAGNRMTVVEEDSERPLTTEGRSEMQKIAKSLRSFGLKADRVCTSPLRRARETAEIAAKTLEIPTVEEWSELKPDGNKEALYRKLSRSEQNSRLILVGHEPYLTSMIGEIIGNPTARLVLKKGGLGKIRITSFTPKISGELRWLLTPKMIAKMS